MCGLSNGNNVLKPVSAVIPGIYRLESDSVIDCTILQNNCYQTLPLPFCQFGCERQHLFDYMYVCCWPYCLFDMILHSKCQWVVNNTNLCFKYSHTENNKIECVMKR